jgi:hypothetical protein
VKILPGFLYLWISLASLPAGAAEPWRTAIAGMPLGTNIAELNRTNCVAILLPALRSNDVVKALIFMPGATDEFYLFRRAHAALTNQSPTLLDAIDALTNQTRIRATFRAPMLLLHTIEYPLQPVFEIRHPDTAARLRQARFLPHAVYHDRDWDFLVPILEDRLDFDFTPVRFSPSSFHFYRHSFAAWNLNGWETLEAVALAGKTRFKIARKQVDFEPDRRVLGNAPMDGFPPR